MNISIVVRQSILAFQADDFFPLSYRLVDLVCSTGWGRWGLVAAKLQAMASTEDTEGAVAAAAADLGIAGMASAKPLPIVGQEPRPHGDFSPIRVPVSVSQIHRAATILADNAVDTLMCWSMNHATAATAAVVSADSSPSRLLSRNAIPALPTAAAALRYRMTQGHWPLPGDNIS